MVPYYWWGGELEYCLPVLHAWVAVDERSDIWTPINGYKWPVPVPNDSTLEQVRIELLNYSTSNEMQHDGVIEYAWLDVLCLRQIGEELDDAQRREEWMTDVPTIGHIYYYSPHDSVALVYFSGLGRPFSNDGYGSPRHWFSRTWTVQEAVSYPYFGGATSSSPILYPQLSGPEFEEFYHHFTLAFGRSSWAGSVFKPVLSQYVTMMRQRHATNERDRISGLASLTQPDRLPIHDASQSDEDAWEVLVKAISGESRAHLFIWYPVAGNARYAWVPSWSQAMAEDVPPADDIL